MLLSALIAELQSVQQEHGDVPVAVCNWASGGWLFSDIQSTRLAQARYGLPTLGGEKNHAVGLNPDRVSDKAIWGAFVSQPEHPVLILSEHGGV